MVVADNLAPIVNAAFGNVGHASGWQLLFATYAFAFQIYCDFSGYTDIAIGSAKLFNLRLMRNFAYPYFAQSIHFWRACLTLGKRDFDVAAKDRLSAIG